MMRHFAILFALLAAGCATTHTVQSILDANGDKTIAIAYYDLRDGTSFLHNEHTVFHAASTMKVPVMLGIFEAVSRGTLRLDQPVRVKNSFTSIFDGSTFSTDPKEDSDSEVYG